jgi:hypothetical protein
MKYKDLKTLQVPQRGPMDPNRKLPGSNHSPAGCQPTKADRIEGIPDIVQRPARKEYDCNAIGPNMKMSNKGYKTVEVRSGSENEEAGEY